ncbi:TRAP transporter large permease subunit [Psychromonas sp. KJ10-10]|uniref:TRAP transporter large permease subunit n=1 Tax=Psychromonas sp. KJ10-10 TaxID=3391823 RepID=UPI0039B61EC8
MSPIEIGYLSVIAIIISVYIGFYIPIALSVISMIAIWLLRDNFELSMNLLKVAVSDSVMEYTFATVPLFTFMGLVVSKAGMGSDIYQVMNSGFRKVKGGIGMATVGANGIFAAGNRFVYRISLSIFKSLCATNVEVWL